MASVDTDRNLLFGLLALQNGLIDQAKLVAAFQAWTLEKARPLAEHLVARGDLDVDDRSAVEALVTRHLKKHGGSTAKSLAALPAARSTRRSLAQLRDPELATSLAGLPNFVAGPESGGERTLDVSQDPSTVDGGSVLARLAGGIETLSPVILPDADPMAQPPAPSGGEGRVSPTPRPDASAYSARSPAAAWVRFTAAATLTSAATWP